MAPIFKDKPPFTPDLAVRQYNCANYSDTLTLEPNTINYNPNPQGSHRKRIRDTTPSANRANSSGNDGRGRSNQIGRFGGRGRGTGHNQRHDRGPPTSILTMRTKVPSHLGCTNPTCRAGGERIYTTHTFDQCTRPGGGASSAGSNLAQVPYPPRNSPATGRGAQDRGAQGRGRGAHGRGRGALAKAPTSTRCRICSAPIRAMPPTGGTQPKVGSKSKPPYQLATVSTKTAAILYYPRRI